MGKLLTWGLFAVGLGVVAIGPMFSLDRSKNDTSVTLDLMRAIAAQMVCVGHAISFFVPPLRATRFPLMQNVGVLLFFILSGFLITYTLIERNRDPAYSFWQFFIERFARIYSGLIPALVFIAIVDGAVIYFTKDPAATTYYNLKTFIANIFMLEGYRGVLPNVLQWSAFGSGAPLWTLAIECHIYMFVGALFFMASRPSSIPYLIPVVLFFGQTPVHFLFGAFQDDGVGTGLFALWLGGACVLFAAFRTRLSYLPAVMLVVASAACFLALTHARHEYDFLSYAFLLIFVFAIIAASQAKRFIGFPKVASAITFLAGYSFTLYLIHHTIMSAVHSIWPGNSYGRFFGTVIASNLIAAAIAAGTEMKHKEFARFLKRGWHNFAEPITATPAHRINVVIDGAVDDIEPVGSGQPPILQ
jgi:peptidoglycan/LPS O-acetylase OafA/YrhL